MAGRSRFRRRPTRRCICGARPQSRRLHTCRRFRRGDHTHPRRISAFALLHQPTGPGRDAILDAFTDRRFEPFDRSVNVLISKLRRKIEPDPKTSRLIVTMPGEGYRFDALAPALRGAAANSATAFYTQVSAEPVGTALTEPEAPEGLPGAEERRGWLGCNFTPIVGLLWRSGSLFSSPASRALARGVSGRERQSIRRHADRHKRADLVTEACAASPFFTKV
jgi:hypothetical protein